MGRSAPDSWNSSLDEDAYIAAVEAVRDHISRGEVYQANICRVLRTPMTPASDIVALHNRLVAGNPAPHAGALRLPDHGVHIASASPELYLRRTGQHLTSRPIKGTGARATDLLAKDEAENVMIVDLVRNDLGRVCRTGTVTVPGLLEVESHPGLVHLVSTVAGDLRPGTTWPQILEATFPPGSVTGAPKLAALDIIRAQEAGPRGPYCGAFGWVDADAGTAELAVAIRTFWREDTGLRTTAGLRHRRWNHMGQRCAGRMARDDVEGRALARGRRRSGGAVKFWVAGGLVPAEQAAVAVLDHGFTVGDGVFETLKTVNDPSVGVVPFAMDRHVARLSRSAAGMGIAMPDPDDVRDALLAVCAANPELADGGRLRVTLTSGPGPLGSERNSGAGTLVVAASPAVAMAGGDDTCGVALAAQRAQPTGRPEVHVLRRERPRARPCQVPGRR